MRKYLLIAVTFLILTGCIINKPVGIEGLQQKTHPLSGLQDGWNMIRYLNGEKTYFAILKNPSQQGITNTNAVEKCRQGVMFCFEECKKTNPITDCKCATFQNFTRYNEWQGMVFPPAPPITNVEIFACFPPGCYNENFFLPFTSNASIIDDLLMDGEGTKFLDQNQSSWL